MTMNNALAGLNAAQNTLSVTSNNIANANTIGFKESRAEFEDVFSAGSAPGKQIGAGARLSRVAQQFKQGDVSFTNRELDFALSGEGFFTLNGVNGLSYTRAGSFSTDPSGYVVTANGQRVQAYQPSTTGTGFDTGRMGDLRINKDASAPSATSRSEVFATLPGNASVPANPTFSPTDLSSFNHTSSLTVFDSLGAEHTQTLYYIKTANPNEWQVMGQIDRAAPTSLGNLQFSDTGLLTLPANGQLVLPTFNPPGGAAAMNITVDVGSTVQYGSKFAVNALTQDGYSTGDYTGIEVDSTGAIIAKYSNGESKALGQLALTRFANDQGLKSIGGNGWQSTSASGGAITGFAGQAGFGAVQGGALEASTVNLTEQLVNMIGAQRTFQANAQTISTIDQTQQAVMNLR